MAKTTIKASDIDKAIAEQLSHYGAEVVESVNAAGLKAIKKLVKLTKNTAPVRFGDYYRSLTYTEKESILSGDKEYTWGAKAPHHRLTHLLVHGHAKQNGGRVDGDPFLEKALDVVLPEYEREVEEAIRNVERNT